MKNEDTSLDRINMLFALKNKLRDKYINYENMSLLVLSQDKANEKLLNLLDSIQYELDMCIQFNDFHRGARYLLLMNMLCKEVFKKEKLETYKKQIDLRIRQ